MSDSVDSEYTWGRPKIYLSNEVRIRLEARRRRLEEAHAQDVEVIEALGKS